MTHFSGLGGADLVVAAKAREDELRKGVPHQGVDGVTELHEDLPLHKPKGDEATEIEVDEVVFESKKTIRENGHPVEEPGNGRKRKPA